MRFFFNKYIIKCMTSLTSVQDATCYFFLNKSILQQRETKYERCLATLDADKYPSQKQTDTWL